MVEGKRTCSNPRNIQTLNNFEFLTGFHLFVGHIFFVVLLFCFSFLFWAVLYLMRHFFFCIPLCILFIFIFFCIQTGNYFFLFSWYILSLLKWAMIRFSTQLWSEIRHLLYSRPARNPIFIFAYWSVSSSYFSYQWCSYERVCA